MITISNLEQKEIIKGFKGRFVHTDKLTIVYWDVEKGAVLPTHSHIHEQVTEILEGQFELTMEGETKVCEPGAVTVIPSNVVHGGVALTDCRIMDIFCPAREEYK